MDFRWFNLGNYVEILASLTDREKSNAIMDLIEACWAELIGEVPVKACYSAKEVKEWKLLTWCGRKNTRHELSQWQFLAR